MSPLALRRYRAERLLRQEFEGLRGRVLATVAGRLRASGVRLDAGDLEACYAMAWQGLYTAVVEGQEIANPTGWLVLVTFRRAIEEHRARARVVRGGGGVDAVRGVSRAAGPSPHEEASHGEGTGYDLAAELDDRMRLRQLFEGLRGRLSARELQAASLCYLQGLSRAEAAAQMGVSVTRMRKLMEGAGPGRPGVAAKVGALVEAIRSGGWCEEQGSLMRGFAYGVLAPGGERYKLAVIHSSECPACRAYVLALRGLAAVFPPVPCLLHWALGGTAAGAGAAGAGAAMGPTAGPGAHAAGGMGASPAAGTGLGGGAAASGGSAAGAVSASGAAGAGAAGGGWLLAGGPVGAKLAVGCLLALGVGAGCVALTERGALSRAPRHGREVARAAPSSAPPAMLKDASGPFTGTAPAAAPRSGTPPRAGAASAAVLESARRASREFGPERSPATVAERPATAGRGQPVAAVAGSAPGGAGGAPGSEAPAAAGPAASSPGSAGSRARSARAPGAQREFAPG